MRGQVGAILRRSESVTKGAVACVCNCVFLCMCSRVAGGCGVHIYTAYISRH